MIKRWKLTIEYDGTPYAGWQRQDRGIVTVQQAVEDAIFAFCQQRITIHAAGRTDAGVHAKGQTAHFDLDYGDRELSGFELAKAISAHLRPQPVAIVAAEETRPEFHARFDARSKLYTYRILNRQAPPTLDENRAWHIRRPLDMDAMVSGASQLIGTHDFTTFRDAECQAKSPVKTLDRLSFAREDESILFHAEARSFLHHQVRNMIGTLAQVGQGKWRPDDVRAALLAKDRRAGGPTAPAHGLYLVEVRY